MRGITEWHRASQRVRLCSATPSRSEGRRPRRGESEMETLQLPAEIGVLPLRNSVLFPHAIMPISVGRRKTLNLLDDVVSDSKVIAVVSQRNAAEDDPDPSGMYRVGTAARILKVVKLSGNNVNLIIQGL